MTIRLRTMCFALVFILMISSVTCNVEMDEELDDQFYVSKCDKADQCSGPDTGCCRDSGEVASKDSCFNTKTHACMECRGRSATQVCPIGSLCCGGICHTNETKCCINPRDSTLADPYVCSVDEKCCGSQCCKGNQACTDDLVCVDFAAHPNMGEMCRENTDCGLDGVCVEYASKFNYPYAEKICMRQVEAIVDKGQFSFTINPGDYLYVKYDTPASEKILCSLELEMIGRCIENPKIFSNMLSLNPDSIRLMNADSLSDAPYRGWVGIAIHFPADFSGEEDPCKRGFSGKLVVEAPHF